MPATKRFPPAPDSLFSMDAGGEQSRDEELVLALTPFQLIMALIGLIIVIYAMRMRRAR